MNTLNPNYDSTNSEAAKNEMEHWFRARYEDPVHKLGCNSREGGYQWAGFDQCDPFEVLGTEFDDDYPQEQIDELASELSLECPEWLSLEQVEADIFEFSDLVTTFLETFENSVARTHSLLALESANAESQSHLYQLLFASAITALETYLADAFRTTVLSDPALIRKFVETNPGFKNEKLSFSGLYSAVEKVNAKVATELSNVIWHNLSRVRKMYKATLDIDLPRENSFVYSSISKRHDIVHRNGKNKDGEQTDVEKPHVLEVLEKFSKFVAEIDSKLQSRPWDGNSSEVSDESL